MYTTENFIARGIDKFSQTKVQKQQEAWLYMNVSDLFNFNYASYFRLKIKCLIIIDN